MSNAISQKQAIIDNVKAILGSNFDSSKSAKDQMSSSDMTLLKSNIVDGIVNNTISYKGPTDLSKVKAYVSGLVSNHFRKAKELNGGASYSPSATRQTTPSSPKKSKKVNSVVSELKVLLSTLEPTSEAYSEVESEISRRLTEA